jgi:hypothetical protein
MDISVPVFFCGASIDWVTMSLPETSWYSNIEGENVKTSFSPVSFVLGTDVMVYHRHAINACWHMYACCILGVISMYLTRLNIQEVLITQI